MSYHYHLTPQFSQFLSPLWSDVVVRESGKMTYQFENNSAIMYNKENLLNPWFIVKDIQ